MEVGTDSEHLRGKTNGILWWNLGSEEIRVKEDHSGWWVRGNTRYEVVRTKFKCFDGNLILIEEYRRPKISAVDWTAMQQYFKELSPEMMREGSCRVRMQRVFLFVFVLIQTNMFKAWVEGGHKEITTSFSLDDLKKNSKRCIHWLQGLWGHQKRLKVGVLTCKGHGGQEERGVFREQGRTEIGRVGKQPTEMALATCPEHCP